MTCIVTPELDTIHIHFLQKDKNAVTGIYTVEFKMIFRMNSEGLSPSERSRKWLTGKL
jgi:hypothetical protein